MPAICQDEVTLPLYDAKQALEVLKISLSYVKTINSNVPRWNETIKSDIDNLKRIIEKLTGHLGKPMSSSETT